MEKKPACLYDISTKAWVSCIADRRRQLSCVGEGVYSDATQLNSTSSSVELSCVAINGPLETKSKFKIKKKFAKSFKIKISKICSTVFAYWHIGCVYQVVRITENCRKSNGLKKRTQRQTSRHQSHIL